MKLNLSPYNLTNTIAVLYGGVGLPFQMTHRFLKKIFIILSNNNFCLIFVETNLQSDRHRKKAIKAGNQFFDIAECYISLSGNP